MAEIVCLGELLIDFVPSVTGVELEGADTFRWARGGILLFAAAAIVQLASALVVLLGRRPVLASG